MREREGKKGGEEGEAYRVRTLSSRIVKWDAMTSYRHSIHEFKRGGEAEEENGRTGRRTPQIPSLCSSLSHSTIAHRVVCNDTFRLYAWLAGLFGFDWPYPGLRTSRSRQLRCGKEEEEGRRTR